MKNAEVIIAIAIAVALGIVNLVIKVNEKMNKKKVNGKFPCGDHKERIVKLEDEHGKLLVAYTDKMGRVETLLGALKESNDREHNSILEKIAEFSNGR